jgi:hypothetical protein
MAREDELLPNDKDVQHILDMKSVKTETTQVFNVYTDIDLVRDYLNDPAFNLVNSEAEADILFIKRHFKNYK